MRDSQYLDAYLRENGRRGPGDGLTPGSFLAYRLRGKRKEWAGRYLYSLLSSLYRAEARGECREGISAHGGTAWYPITNEEED